MTEPVRVVLASASPRRRELLAAILDGFEVAVAAFDEHEEPPVETLAERLARGKAEAAAAAEPGAVILAADTVVEFEGTSLDKPANAGEARAMLRRVTGKWHEVHTGVAVAGDGVTAYATVTSRVLMAQLDVATIDAYVASGRPLDKAGAYGIQDEDVPTVERLDGCYCAVMGLPLWTTGQLLLRAGVTTHEPAFDRCAGCPDRREGYRSAK